jgi:hypothetical protein
VQWLIIINIPPRPYDPDNSNDNKNARGHNDTLPFLLPLPFRKLAFGYFTLGLQLFLFSQRQSLFS